MIAAVSRMTQMSAWLLVTLGALALVLVTACGDEPRAQPSGAPPSPAGGQTAAAPATPAGAAARPPAATAAVATLHPSPAEPAGMQYKGMPVSRTSDEFFVLGQPDAPVTLTEYSDFL